MVKSIIALLICLSTVFAFSEQPPKGLLITAVGLPGCGKSAVMSELAELIDGSCFCQPEEEDWGDAVKLRHLSGNFTMLNWFRAVRVPQLYRANQLRSTGEIAITDSYYDKLLAYYLGQPGMEWLIDPKDPYFNAAMTIAKTDWEHLPNADVIIFFEVSVDLWKNFLTKRNRLSEVDPKILESYATQDLFYSACKKLAHDQHMLLIKIDQDALSPREKAEKIREILCAKGMIHPK